MQITDLQPDDAVAIEQAADMLIAGFRDQAPDAWPDFAAARNEVHKALEPSKVCRVARDADGTLLGWIGGQPFYARSGSCILWLLLPPLNDAGSGALWCQIWRYRFGSAVGSLLCSAAMMRPI